MLSLIGLIGAIAGSALLSAAMPIQGAMRLRVDAAAERRWLPLVSADRPQLRSDLCQGQQPTGADSGALSTTAIPVETLSGS
jgi:hypothetical protein